MLQPMQKQSSYLAMQRHDSKLCLMVSATVLIQDIIILQPSNCTFRQSELGNSLKHPFLLRFFRPNALCKCVEGITDSSFGLLWEPVSIISITVCFDPVVLVDSLLLQEFDQA